ncbi:serine/threonine-protein kinase TAO2 isoform X1 [Apis cerana]|uniref:serine/threonine-protein kinase TAO2 isoform X1 n=1 Tax=Apis cerana TaxID=7461 RepID=UPI0007E2CB57|nr:serine/threonine-protein kinase TAO2 isoform X1 [Apis cerana]
MKLAIFAFIAMSCLIAVVRSAEEEYDYEEEPAAPVTPAPARSGSGRLGGLLSSRGRVSVGRKSAAPAAQSTTAKAIEQPAAEAEEEEEEELEDNQEQEEAPTTTTESSKKVRGGVRPFRSNQDLLDALKRRRAQAGPTTSHRDTSATQTATESTTPKSKATTHSRNKSNGATSETKSTGRGRFGGTRGSKPLQEEVEETQREEVQVKPKPYRRG